MSKDQDSSESKIERELRNQQKFTMAGAIGRSGSGFMKGESPVSPQEQAIILLTQWIDQHTPDPSGALKSILRRRVRDSQLLVGSNLNQPYNVLIEIINSILTNDYTLMEFVTKISIRWGELYQERPLFQALGEEPKPGDEYPIESVRQTLNLLLEKLR